MMCTNTGKTALWFLVGVGLGLLGAVLYAPLAGKDARRYVVKAARKAAGTGRDVYKTGCELLDKTEEVVEAGVKAAKA